MAKNKNKLVPFSSKGKPAKKGQILDEGTLSKLKYRVFKRGNIHIFNSTETLLFKKDCELFEAEVDNLNLNVLKDGESKRIEGSGDNDTLIFSCVKGDIVISLEKRTYNMLSKLKKILQRKK